MKILQLFIFLFTIVNTSLAIDKMPVICVRIDKSIISNVDSVFLINDSQIQNSTDRYKVTSDQKEYLFKGYHGVSKISIKLKNSPKHLNDTTLITEKNATFVVKQINDKICFQQYHRSKLMNIMIQLIVLFLTLLLVKIPIAMLIMTPDSKKRFLINFGMINLLYLLVLIGLIVIMQDLFIGAIYLFMILIMISADLIFLNQKYNEKGILRPIIATIASNALFFIIGLLLIILMLWNIN